MCSGREGLYVCTWVERGAVGRRVLEGLRREGKYVWRGVGRGSTGA